MQNLRFLFFYISLPNFYIFIFEYEFILFDASCDLFIIPLSPTTMYNAADVRSIKIILVTTRCIKAIPFVFFLFFHIRFSPFYFGINFLFYYIYINLICQLNLLLLFYITFG